MKVGIMRNSLSLFAILFFGALLGWPGIWSGLIFGHDTLSHLLMSRNFSNQFWSGDIYPRWLWQLNAGFGSPVFHFYGPVPFYVAACLKPLFSNDPEGWHQIGLAASMALILSGFSAYAWLRNISGEKAALAGAVLYMVVPYHLSIDFYQRFSFGELWGFVWMPLILLFVRGIAKHDNKAIIGLAVSYSLLVMTHLPTTLLFSPLVLIYALWAPEYGARLQSFMRVSAGMAVGMGLSAVYLLPALTQQGDANFDVMRSGHFLFQNSFLSLPESLFDGSRRFSSGLARSMTLLLVVMLVVRLHSKKLTDDRKRREQQFWVVVAVVAFMMMLGPSEPIWQLFPLFQKVQFAWRLGAIMTLATVAIVSLWVETAGCFRIFRNPVAAAILALIFILQMLPLFENVWIVRHLSSEPSIAFFKGYFKDNNTSVETQLSAAEFGRYGFFLPKSADMKLFLDSPESVSAMTRWASEKPIAQIRNGEGVISSSVMQPARIEFYMNSKTGGQVALHQFYYPGWVAFMEGRDTRLVVSSTEPDGLVAVDVPPGSHLIRLERELLPDEVLGRNVSVLAVLLLVAIVLWTRWQGHSGRQGNQEANDDRHTADAFATSWNHLPEGSVYTREQFEDWLHPITAKDILGKNVLELGCGNGSLMIHMFHWEPKHLDGVDLGDSVISAQRNMSKQPFSHWTIHKADMIGYKSEQPRDVVYSIGVLHHLKNPKEGLDSVIANTARGGRFHCWVYAKEGNGLVRLIVDPIRIISSRLPWWITKYCVATPLVMPYFLYAKAIGSLGKLSLVKNFPLYEYSLWISRRNFGFFRHVAFDQLVTPQTTYISESTIRHWLSSYDNVDRGSLYVIMRNGNSWKFGGVVK